MTNSEMLCVHYRSFMEQFVEVFFIKVFQPFSGRMEVMVKLSDSDRLAVFPGISSFPKHTHLYLWNSCLQVKGQRKLSLSEIPE